MSNIDIDTNEDYFEQVWPDKGIILRCDACHRPLNTQTLGEGGSDLMDVSYFTFARVCTCLICCGADSFYEQVLIMFLRCVKST